MKVVLVNPPRVDGLPVIREERCEITERYSVLPPYSLLQIAGLLREKGHEPWIVDANGFDLDYSELKHELAKELYDALIFRFTPTTFDADMKTAALSKSVNRSATTIAICWTLRTVPEQVLRDAQDVDIYLRHEYEVVAPELINALKRGRDPHDVKGIAYRLDRDDLVTQDEKPIIVS